MAIGPRIRAIRESLGISIKDMAEKVDVSPSMISQLERELTNPSVALLKNISDVLGVKVGMLFLENNIPSVVVRKGERKRIVYKDGKMIHEFLAPISDRKIEFIYNIYKPGGAGDLLVHNGEECALVLQGKAKLCVGDDVYELEEGDSIYHDSTIPHSIANSGDVDLVVVYAITPPSF